MFANFLPRWRRRAVCVAALGAVLLAAAAVAGTAASGSVAPAAADSGPTVLAGGQAGSRAQVPWASVGPGWELAEYSAGTPAHHLPTMLYLVNPAGGRYLMDTWPARAFAPGLVAWSGDKTRALLLSGSTGQSEQLTLATGQLTTFALAGHAVPIGYTRPSGLNILGVQLSGSRSRFARYSLTGQLVMVLATAPPGGWAMYSRDGTELAVTSNRGLQLVSNRGGVIGQLPVPGTVTGRCLPARWWNSGTVLASCLAPGTAEDRLWLVPASGARPTALTPQRGASSQDLGDVDAWQLPSGLYTQGLGACGTAQIYQQAAGGSVTPVMVPHTTGNNVWVVTVAGPKMLLNAQTGCPGSRSLVWFNPATHAERLAAIRAAAADAGVPIVINARADTFLPGSGVPEEERVAEAVRRGGLYLAAGADCIYPIGVSDEKDIAALVAGVPGPINANTRPGGPDLAKLRELGVARVSYGPRLYREALANLKAAVQELLA
jgi:hypothetical protein